MRRLRRDFEGILDDYDALVRDMLAKPLPDYRWYRGVMPSWDNTARSGTHAYIAVGGSPDAYRRWLGELVVQALARS